MTSTFASSFSGFGPLRQLFRTALFEAADHVLLPPDFLLLFLVCSKFADQADLFLLSIKGIIAFVNAEPSVFDFKNPVDGVVQEITVVRDDDHCSLISAQVLFQPFQGTDVQMVGGLV